MLTVTKTVKFDAAHVLTNHAGLCKNLHGHTYRVDVSARASAPDEGGMVIDFKDLKTIATDVICSKFDHAFIYNRASAGEREIASVVERLGMRTVELTFRSTAENLARHFYSELKPRIPALSSVTVWETAESCAEYREEDGAFRRNAPTGDCAFGRNAPTGDCAFGRNAPTEDCAFGRNAPTGDCAFRRNAPTEDCAFGRNAPTGGER